MSALSATPTLIAAPTRTFPRSGYTVVVPRSHAPSSLYRRRRLAAFGVLVFVLALVLLGVGQVLANRGGDPASIPMVRPATSYVVQPGDTMWSLAAEFHGPWSRADYLDQLLHDNGGSRLAIGQLLHLP
ncbi:MAG: hypothetical protein JWM12_466 [Ilumatobacteraceae bacterium]|nr:hypothetical protein [Ilumatobacteraceae bacterium]